jgi:hypothetical protein
MEPKTLPPEELACLDCSDAACVDGMLDGRDGDGRETSDICNCPCHDPAGQARMLAEIRMDQAREA